MTEEQLVRLETALDKFEAYLIRAEKIDKLKTEGIKQVFDIETVNKAFNKAMSKYSQPTN